jgi:putative transposase
MPRANRYFRYYPAGYPWHITHRCHNQNFLLAASHDRKRWREWLCEAKKRFGLRVLNYCVTCNHIHLIVLGSDDPLHVSRSMQLTAGRTAEEYNHRKGRKGAFWEDRYHATIIDSGEYFSRCMTYVDLNMVRAGVVSCPETWLDCGYRELTMKRRRNTLIDRNALADLTGEKVDSLGAQRQRAVSEALASGSLEKDERWSECLAVGSENFIEQLKGKLGKCLSTSQRINSFAPQPIAGVSEPLRTYGGNSRAEMHCLTGSNKVYLVV